MLVLVFYTVFFLIGILCMPKYVAARFCEGGHICSLPRECCTQGCCPPYQSGPRQLPPPSEHVLNLFFISHWFFWCVVVAIILAILCAYSLWKKRRTLCGWGFAEHNAQSEGDSAGSCYAPPQYSRCSSFHHPPPPYTEVTSKPDLYPLVFTCNSDNGKNGSSYLMVQYFRNYILRPAGSLSAASTVDSLSSSFICNVNEANTLVPPPYSRAASPDVGFSSHFQQQDQVYQQHNNSSHYTALRLTEAGGEADSDNATAVAQFSSHMRGSESGNFISHDSGENTRCHSAIGGLMGSHREQRVIGGFLQSQSDQHFRYITNSSSSISDIFVNNSCTAGIGGAASQTISASEGRSDEGAAFSSLLFNNTSGSDNRVRHPQAGGTPVIYSNGCIKPNPLHRTNTNPTQFAESKRDHPVYNSCNSIGGISITVPVAAHNSETEFRDLHMLRRSLETCCQLLHKQQQQQHQQQQQMSSTTSFVVNSDLQMRLGELTKKYTEEGLRSYLTSGTCSGVSSLANIGTPSSPPQATSPTDEVKEILDQIRQLQEDTSYDDIFTHTARPSLSHTMSTPSPTHSKLSTIESNGQLQRYATLPEREQQNQNVATSPISANVNAHEGPISSSQASISSLVAASTPAAARLSSANTNSGRPSSLHQQPKKKFYSQKPNKAMYIPMMATNPSPLNRCILKSPVSNVVSGSFFTNRTRSRKGWISRSAPTTPATPFPPNRLGDDASPLLNEHEEDQEGEQSEEME